MSLTTHPLPVLRCSLTMHLRERRLNCLTSACFCPMLSVPASDHRPDDRSRESDNTRDDRPRRITHRAILAWTQRDHNIPPIGLHHFLHSMGTEAINLDP